MTAGDELEEAGAQESVVGNQPYSNYVLIKLLPWPPQGPFSLTKPFPNWDLLPLSSWGAIPLS